MKYLLIWEVRVASLLLVLGALLFSVRAHAGLVDDLEAKGEQKGVAPCVVYGHQMTCVIVTWKGETYSVAGYVKDGDFYAKYVAKQVKDKWVVVWTYGNDI